MGRGPARSINFSEDGLWLGLTLTFSKFTTRPGPAHYCFKSLGSAWPGPSHGSEAHKHGLYMGQPDNCVGRPMCCPVLKGACAYADVIF